MNAEKVNEPDREMDDLDRAIALFELQLSSTTQFEEALMLPIDDQEIDKMILTEAESEFKARVWNNLNRDWLK